MKIYETDLSGAYMIEPQVFGDARGWFTETFNERKLKELGLKVPVFVQDNQSYSAQKGIIRGLHCQTNPHAQTKLIRCTRGEIYDIIVDIREGSPTYKHWVKILLSAENKKQLWIPKGFLHGFMTLSDHVEVQYKVDEFYHKESDRSVCYNDPEFGIDWGIDSPILSDKDKFAPLFSESDIKFSFEG